MPKTAQKTNPTHSALSGILYSLPFLTLNTVISNQNQSFLGVLRPEGKTSLFEYLVLLVVLFLLPVGAYISLFPMLGNRSHKKFYMLNFVVSAVLLTAFGVLLMALGTEIYRCDIVNTPNCD